MDARTGVQRQQPSKTAWKVTSTPGRVDDRAVAVADPAAARPRNRDGDDRISVDPLRATDRYRLVMPYAEDV